MQASGTQAVKIAGWIGLAAAKLLHGCIAFGANPRACLAYSFFADRFSYTKVNQHQPIIR
jgi:hypothetical protein